MTENFLGQMRPVDGKWHGLAATPTGDKLIVSQYQGEVGVLVAGKGDRKIEGLLGMQGCLASKERFVPIADFGPELSTALKDPDDDRPFAEKITLPAGDYYPSMMTVHMGRLSIEISNNYHTDGHPLALGRDKVYGIKIRKDQPYVLDFSNKPEVLFANPAKETTVKPGQDLRVDAVLIDPVLDIMIRGLEDTSRTAKQKLTIGRPNGAETREFDMPLSLEPKVVITDAAGKTVAEGVMPFG